ncbi:hypothetical protein [Helicobacter pylori]|uniref:hypothetical protein n=1 Tax=Helicobacter pylori TaxID=210 RepID=UPI0013CE1657|nr:hypothetical protein [Helicobacter pylori]
MRQENETASSFNELKEITQAIQALKNSAQTNANNQASEPTQERGLKPKATAHAKKARLSPTKKAFSEREKTTIRDNANACTNARIKAIQEQGDNANAFKSDETNNSNLRAEPSAKAQEQGLKNTQENQKGANNEAK